MKLLVPGKGIRWPLAKKLLVIMKLTTTLILISALHVSATTFSQKVSIKGKDLTLKAIFANIEKQTGYQFVYYQDLIEKSKPVTLDVYQVELTEVLNQCLPEQKLSYEIANNIIVIKPLTQGLNPGLEQHFSAALPPPIDVRGRITTLEGDPVAGASVMVKGSNKGTTSDVDGNFVLKSVDENDVLVISGANIERIEWKIDGKSDLNVMVKKMVNPLDEVVFKGYYSTSKRLNTGSVSKVTSSEIEKQPVINPLQTLHGRMPGVYVSQLTGIPGAGIKISIRGQNSLRTLDNSGVDANAPLYVIDGLPYSFETLSSRFTNSPIFAIPASPLNGINSSDIESIEVLKDADATSIYGSKGANGVILITTKKGKAGKTKLNINLNMGIGKVTQTVDMLNTNEYLAMRNEAFSNDNSTPSSSDYDVNDTWEKSRYTNWQKVLIGGSAQTNLVQASLTGGNTNTQFLCAGTYRRETTVFPGDFRYLRGSGQLSLSHTSSNKKLTANLSVNYSADDNKQAVVDFTSRSLTLAPNAPNLYNEDGSLNWENSTWTNPLGDIGRTYDAKTNTLISNASFNYEIVPELHIKANLGITNVQSKEISKIPHTVFDPSFGQTSANSRAIVSQGTLKNWIIEPQILWKKVLGSNQLDVLFGTSFQDQSRNVFAYQIQGFSNNALIGNPVAASSFVWRDFNITDYKYNAFFGRLNYSLYGKYIANITGRRDGSSRFGPGKQFTNFGAVGLAWIFSNETLFVKKLPFLSFGKLRVSYGATGNDQIGDFQFVNRYSPTPGYQGVNGLDPVALFNPNFAWEINKKFEAAVSLGFAKDRIWVDINYYRNRSSNQLVGYPLPLTTGFASIIENFPATVQNTGVEVELKTINIKSNNSFEWTSSFNLTLPKNKLVSFPGLESSSYASQYVVGKSLFIQKFYHFLGVDQATGIARFEDYNKDGLFTFSADKMFIKEISQRYYGGINNSITFKNWQISFFVQFVKQTGFNNLSSVPLPGGFIVNQPFLILERWQKPGDVTAIQRFATSSNSAALSAANLLRQSDAAVGDASFVRLKNVSLSYTLPTSLIRGVREGVIYIQGQNLFTFTKYKWLDVETQSDKLPPLTIITAGLNFSF